MKIQWSQKYNTIAMYAFIVLSSAILFFVIISGLSAFTKAFGNYVSVLYPFFYGFIIAYLLNFLYIFLEKIFGKMNLLQKQSKIRRLLNILLSYVIGAAFVAIFLGFILPQLIISITGLVVELPRYIRGTSDYISKISEAYILDPRIVEFLNDRWAILGDQITKLASDLLPAAFTLIRTTAMSIWNVVLGIIISIYFLTDKEKLLATSKKAIYGLFGKKIADRLVTLITRTQRIFSQFLVGKVLDSLIIGAITFVVLSFLKMPYVVLITFIITVTNIVPFFGPFIGAIPSIIIILFVSPIKALWFLIFIIILQQVDGNYIGPKILGDSMGISSFWILFSILVSGKILGFAGLIVGVPIFVLIYSIAKEYLEEKLKNKGLPEQTMAYHQQGIIMTRSEKERQMSKNEDFK